MPVMFLNTQYFLYLLVFFIVVIAGYVSFILTPSNLIYLVKRKQTNRHHLSVSRGGMLAMTYREQYMISFTGSGKKLTRNCYLSFQTFPGEIFSSCTKPEAFFWDFCTTRLNFWCILERHKSYPLIFLMYTRLGEVMHERGV